MDHQQTSESSQSAAQPQAQRCRALVHTLTAALCDVIIHIDPEYW